MRSDQTTTQAVPPPKPPAQIIHELCVLLGLFHLWGSESGAVGAMPEWQKRRYAWALQQVEDSGGLEARGA